MSLTKLLVIDTRVSHYQVIIDSRKPDVAFVLLDYYNDTYQSLLDKINSLAFLSISSVAFVSHGNMYSSYRILDKESFCIVENVAIEDPSLSSWVEFKNFWTSLGAPVIDLLGCALYMSDDWKYVLNTLESQMSVNFRASVDDTGSLAVGGNWVLESDNVNIKDVYFTENIESWVGKLSGDTNTSLFISKNRKVYGMGRNADGQLGLGNTTSPIIVPTLISTISNENIVHADSGLRSSTFVTSSGKVYSAGDNLNGQLGQGNTTDLNLAKMISDLSHVKIIQSVITDKNALFLDASGRVYSCGSNGYGQLGLGTSGGSDVTRPTLIQSISNEVVVQVTLGIGGGDVANSAAAVTQDGKLYTWGNNAGGQLGLWSTSSIISTPQRVTRYFTTIEANQGTDVSLPNPIIQVSMAGPTMYFVDSAGYAYASGNNGAGRLGIDADSTNTPEVTIARRMTTGVTDISVAQVCAGRYGGYLLSTNSKVYSWGEGANYQLGLRNQTNYGYPRFVSDLSNVNITQVYMGEYYAMCLDNSGSVYGVGINSNRQLGQSTTNSVTQFKRLTELSGIEVVSLGSDNRYLNMNRFVKIVPEINGTLSSSPLSYGQSLSSSTITGSMREPVNHAIIDGTFAFSDPSVKPTVSDTTASFTFTPTNTSYYEIVNGTINITVNKSIPTIVTSDYNPSVIPYGTNTSLLGNISLISTINEYDGSEVEGTLELNTIHSDENPVGTVEHHYIFTPTDYDNYETIDVYKFVTVEPATPSVEVILNGESFNTTQTYSDIITFTAAWNPNSMWSVTGTFELTGINPSDTVTEGEHTVSWSFTPDNQTNYVTVYGDVYFTVQPNLITPSAGDDVYTDPITYGQYYNEPQINYSFYDPNTFDNVEGTVTINWTEPTNIPPVGINFYSYTFYPNYISIYGTYTGTLQLEVLKATPTTTILSVSSINLGDTLGSAGFTYEFANPINNEIVSGSISFDSPSTVPTANDETSYSWTFVPSDTNSYENVTGSIQVTVISAGETPSLSGSITSTNNTGNASVLASDGSMEQVSLSGLNAVFIPFGSKLSSTPISGSFVNQSSQSVEGVLRFTNPNYVPTLSDTTANWTFTPANRSLYNIVTGSVSIKVGYPVGAATVIPIITNIASNMDVSSSPTETVFVDKEVFGNSGLVLTQALTNSVQLESRLSTTTTDTSYVPVTVVGQTATNSFSNVPYSVSLSNIPPNKPALYTLLPSPYFSSPIQNATTLAVMSYRIIDSNTNSFVSDLTATPITAEFNLGSTYANQALTVHHIDASNNVTSSTNITADANGVIIYQITKNPNLIVTTQVINNGNNVSIFLPYIFDLSANGVVFGEEVQSISADYFLEEDVSKSTLTVSLLKSALKYKDDLDLLYINDLSSEELPVPSQQSINDIASRLNRIVDVSNLKYWQGSTTYTNSQTAFSNGSLGEQYIQYIASVLFGHPQAQAPIKNDEQIIIDLCNCDIGAQFGGSSGLSDLDVRKFIFEQLVNNSKNTSNASGSRFDISDTDPTPSSGYVSYPFEEGDEIIIRIRMSGGLDADTASSFSQSGTSSTPIDMVNIFGQTQGITNNNNSLSITPKVWAIKFIIGA